MAGYRDPWIITEELQPNGDLRILAKFFVAGSVFPRKFDAQVGERIFVIRAEVLEVMKSFDIPCNPPFEGKGGKTIDKLGMNPATVLYLYTGKHKLADIAVGDIIVDLAILQTILKRLFR